MQHRSWQLLAVQPVGMREIDACCYITVRFRLGRPVAILAWFGSNSGKLLCGVVMCDRCFYLSNGRAGGVVLKYSNEGAPTIMAIQLRAWLQHGCAGS
jgi:hypothetical protein